MTDAELAEIRGDIAYALAHPDSFIMEEEKEILEQCRTIDKLLAEVERLRAEVAAWEEYAVELADTAFGDTPPGFRLKALRKSVAARTATSRPGTTP